MGRYLFDNAAPQARDRFSALEICYDKISQQNLTRAGVKAGDQCLEIGGGGGSLAAWLARAVGRLGHVTVTDVNPSRMEDFSDHANVTVLRHDVTRDPLPEQEYDLIHARLVLLHLRERHSALDRLTRALKPGGTLMLEEFDCTWIPVHLSPDSASTALFEKVHQALLDLLSVQGADVAWGSHAYAALCGAGLVEVSTTTYAETWTGGSPGCELHCANTLQLAEPLLQAGITEDELRAFYALLRNSGFAVAAYPLICIQGVRGDS